jgi:hypothetical protein
VHNLKKLHSNSPFPRVPLGFRYTVARYQTPGTKTNFPRGNHSSTQETIKISKLLTIEQYIQRRKTTISSYIKDTKIYDNCQLTIPASRKTKCAVWWDNTIPQDDELVMSKIPNMGVANNLNT